MIAVWVEMEAIGGKPHHGTALRLKLEVWRPPRHLCTFLLQGDAPEFSPKIFTTKI